MRSIRIAILGAGFSGVATAWHLQNYVNGAKITLFDPGGLGGGASGVSAGLMHPYTGAHAKLNWRGNEGYATTSRMLQEAEKTLGEPVSHRAGMLRVALTEEQQCDFSLCAKKHEDVVWYSPEQCQELIPGVQGLGGIFIKSAITVNPFLYITGLWKACEAKGAVLERKAINFLEELPDYDFIIVALGHNCKQLPELANLPLTPIKGQILELEWPRDVRALPFPINSQAYLIMHPNGKSCYVGATFERHFKDSRPDVAIAAADLIPKVEALLPALKGTKILDCRAGVRASAPLHQPLIKRIDKRTWVITGMGSKGLLYHALYAEELARQVI